MELNDSHVTEKQTVQIKILADTVYASKFLSTLTCVQGDFKGAGVETWRLLFSEEQIASVRFIRRGGR